MNANSHSATAPVTDRQAEILDRAAELVAEQGLANLTLKKVAARVGFSEPAIYRHFPNKHALVLGLVDRLGERLLTPMGVHAADASRPPRDRLLAMVRHHLGVLRVTRGLPILLIAEGLASGDAELVARLGGVMQRYLGLLSDVVAELDLPLAVAPPRLASLFLGLPAALGIQMRALPELALADDEAEALLRYYVDALTLSVSRGEPGP